MYGSEEAGLDERHCCSGSCPDDILLIALFSYRFLALRLVFLMLAWRSGRKMYPRDPPWPGAQWDVTELASLEDRYIPGDTCHSSPSDTRRALPD